jgi:hypothetical protein
LVLEYYSVLHAIFRGKPHLRRCLARCCLCRIYFLTHFRNAGRHDLRCPFGCRQAHCRQQSNQRSGAYYREPEGKRKKRDLNQRRAAKAPVSCPEAESAKVPLPGKISPVIVAHVQMALGLIEGRRIRRGEVMELLSKVLRQHTMEWKSQSGHVQSRPHKQPP